MNQDKYQEYQEGFLGSRARHSAGIESSSTLCDLSHSLVTGCATQSPQSIMAPSLPLSRNIPAKTAEPTKNQFSADQCTSVPTTNAMILSRPITFNQLSENENKSFVEVPDPNLFTQSNADQTTLQINQSSKPRNASAPSLAISGNQSPPEVIEATWYSDALNEVTHSIGGQVQHVFKEILTGQPLRTASLSSIPSSCVRQITRVGNHLPPTLTEDSLFEATSATSSNVYRSSNDVTQFFSVHGNGTGSGPLAAPPSVSQFSPSSNQTNPEDNSTNLFRKITNQASATASSLDLPINHENQCLLQTKNASLPSNTPRGRPSCKISDSEHYKRILNFLTDSNPNQSIPTREDSSRMLSFAPASGNHLSAIGHKSQENNHNLFSHAINQLETLNPDRCGEHVDQFSRVRDAGLSFLASTDANQHDKMSNGLPTQVTHKKLFRLNANRPSSTATIADFSGNHDSTAPTINASVFSSSPTNSMQIAKKDSQPSAELSHTNGFLNVLTDSNPVKFSDTLNLPSLPTRNSSMLSLVQNNVNQFCPGDNQSHEVVGAIANSAPATSLNAHRLTSDNTNQYTLLNRKGNQAFLVPTNQSVNLIDQRGSQLPATVAGKGLFGAMANAPSATYSNANLVTDYVIQPSQLVTPHTHSQKGVRKTYRLMDIVKDEQVSLPLLSEQSRQGYIFPNDQPVLPSRELVPTNCNTAYRPSTSVERNSQPLAGPSNSSLLSNSITNAHSSSEYSTCAPTSLLVMASNSQTPHVASNKGVFSSQQRAFNSPLEMEDRISISRPPVVTFGTAMTASTVNSSYRPLLENNFHTATITNTIPASSVLSAPQSTMSQTYPTLKELRIIQEKPKRPEKALLPKRLETFRDWPADSKQTKEDLANAGFFYTGQRDSVRCFFCGGGLRNWQPEDNAYVEHARVLPKCFFIKQKLGQEFIDTVRKLATRFSQISFQMVLDNMTKDKERFSEESKKTHLQQDAAVLTLCAVGFREKDVLDAAESLEATGEDLSSDILYIKLVEKGIQPEKPIELNQQRKECDSSAASSSAHQDNETKEEHLNALKEINHDLRAQTTCKVCWEKHVSFLFLPCGHLVCCLDCAWAMKDCPVCRKEISGMVKTEMN